MASMESTMKVNTTVGVDVVETMNVVETVEPGEPAAIKRLRPDLVGEAWPIGIGPIGVAGGVRPIGVVGSGCFRTRCKRSQQDH